ncbi:MAG: 1-deoxy-D-xylulose-5-phosphate reductoisomerase [Firmicutes bacterium]|nr:1-deoxy-D-xylulose-5-phosphate reductoisomerase [Bacillota bacterium]
MKSISILGSTGSIGTQTLDIVRENPGLYRVEALSCGKNTALLAEQIREFKPKFAAVSDEAEAQKLAGVFPNVTFFSGESGLVSAVCEADCDMVVNALVGMVGLSPTYHALEKGKTVALANKETLVAGGSIIMDKAAEKGINILPIDSEHSAVFQCLQGYDRAQVSRIILTASGGPFRGKSFDELAEVTVEQALDHPNWNMGNKITIDSATMMNKGFEVIEARWLFDIPESRIDVVVHPESIIHSLVEYEDHAVMAQLGLPDMKIPISLALSYPKRLKNDMERLDLAAVGSLTFEKPNMDTFKCLKLAYDVLKAGGTYCTALNAANEVCVAAFLAGKIRFTAIQETLAEIIELHKSSEKADLQEVLRIDNETRKITGEILRRREK